MWYRTSMWQNNTFEWISYTSILITRCLRDKYIWEPTAEERLHAFYSFWREYWTRLIRDIISGSWTHQRRIWEYLWDDELRKELISKTRLRNTFEKWLSWWNYNVLFFSVEKFHFFFFGPQTKRRRRLSSLRLNFQLAKSIHKRLRGVTTL